MGIKVSDMMTGNANTECSPSRLCYLLTEDEARIAFQAIGEDAVRARCDCDNTGYRCGRCKRLEARVGDPIRDNA